MHFNRVHEAYEVLRRAPRRAAAAAPRSATRAFENPRKRAARLVSFQRAEPLAEARHPGRADAAPCAVTPTRSNPTKRAVYDLYGHEGLRAGLEVGPRLKTREEIRAEFESLKAACDARAAEARVNYRGSYMFGAWRCCCHAQGWLQLHGLECAHEPSRRAGR